MSFIFAGVKSNIIILPFKSNTANQQLYYYSHSMVILL